MSVTDRRKSEERLISKASPWTWFCCKQDEIYFLVLTRLLQVMHTTLNGRCVYAVDIYLQWLTWIRWATVLVSTA
jgi:hypothetical protein